MAVRIRAATTLSVIILIAFGLQLVSVLSAPITSKISLCSFDDHIFGVFGYCIESTGKCSSVGIGYDMLDNSSFSLPSNARQSLSKLLIVHPIAAGFTFILFVLTLIANFHEPSSSSRFLLCVLIFVLPTFLLALLAFLVDILLFVPKLAWGGWILLGSTILIAISGFSVCVMRRSLSSRKAMKKRITDFDNNMDGDNAFNNPFDFNHIGSRNGAFGKRDGFASGNDDYEFSEIRYESSNKGAEDTIPLTNNSVSSQHRGDGDDSFAEGDYTLNSEPELFATTSNNPAAPYLNNGYNSLRSRNGSPTRDYQGARNQMPYSDASNEPPVPILYPNQPRNGRTGSPNGVNKNYNRVGGPQYPAGTYPNREGHDDLITEDFGPNVIPLPKIVNEFRPNQQLQRPYPERGAGDDDIEILEDLSHVARDQQQPIDYLQDNERDIMPGSPALSESSDFTSVSQRGVNPMYLERKAEQFQQQKQQHLQSQREQVQPLQFQPQQPAPLQQQQQQQQQLQQPVAPVVDRTAIMLQSNPDFDLGIQGKRNNNKKSLPSASSMGGRDNVYGNLHGMR